MKTVPISLPAFLLLLTTAFSGCEQSSPTADAYGNFEAAEVVVSAESPGRLLHFEVKEGERIPAGQVVGLVDTMPLHLQKQLAIAEKEATASQTQGVLAQISVINEELKVMETEQKRLQNLVRDSAATPQQLDEVEGRINVARRRIRSIESQNAPVISKMKAIDRQIAILDDKIARCKVVNPLDGTVLYKLAEPGEIAATGKPLYRIAPLDEMYLRAYLNGDQLGQVRLGQSVEVMVDAGGGKLTKLPGEVSWISSEAEFTPKIVQTRENRVNLVYAFKVRVPNDGTFKIGMPGEVSFHPSNGKEAPQPDQP